MDEFKDCHDINQNSKYKHERTIIHIDLDCFYAQVEMLKNPELSTKPVGIKQQHYVITSNYVAREFGVKKCMTITEALALCPKLVIISGEDLHDYRNMSSKVTDVIKQFSSKVEKLGLDENFVDVSNLVASKLDSKDMDKNTIIGHIHNNETEYFCNCGCKERLTVGSHIASKIRERIRSELGMTCCAGISYNKLLAKLVGPTRKPNQQTTIFPCSAMSFISNLKCVKAIPGIGRKTTNVLDTLGICSVSDVQNSSTDVLQRYLDKSLASWIKKASFGVDDTDVKESGKQQVIGLEEASKKISCMQEVQNKLKYLIERGMILLQEDGRFPTTLRVSVRKYFHDAYTKQRESKQCIINSKLFKSCTAKEQIFEIALILFKKLVDHNKPFHITLIGLAFTNFQEDLSAKGSLAQFLLKKSSKDTDKDNTKIKNFTKGVKVCTKDNVSYDINCHKYLDKSVLNELPEEIRSEVVQNYSNQVRETRISNVQTLQYDVQCPPEIDKNIFIELPYDIQIELSTAYDNSSKNCIPKVTTKSKKQSSILNYFHT